MTAKIRNIKKKDLTAKGLAKIERSNFDANFKAFPERFDAFPNFERASRFLACFIFLLSFPSQENSLGVRVYPRPLMKL